jgi:hypothetical protein
MPGRYIPEEAVKEPSRPVADVPGVSRLWRDAVNRPGGDVTLVHLPEAGIRGKTPFMMSDPNSLQIADPLSAYLAEKGRVASGL